MKKYLLRFREVNRDIFEAIRDGRKTVETRAATAKYRGVKAGDIIVLTCGKDRFEKEVRHAEIFKSIATMLKKYSVKDIIPMLSSAKELQAAYFSYPNYRDKIKKFGLIALEFK